jgi:hypothetical protein
MWSDLVSERSTSNLPSRDVPDGRYILERMSSDTQRAATRSSQLPTVRPPPSSPLDTDDDVSEGPLSGEVQSWLLEVLDAAESEGGLTELQPLESSKRLSLPPLKRRRHLPPIPREDPE